MANLLLSIMDAFAEFERALIRERQHEGITLVKNRGGYVGRKKVLSDQEAARLRQRVLSREKETHLALELGISRETLYQYLRATDDSSRPGRVKRDAAEKATATR